ncbi:MAG: dihydroorotase [Bdellovibrionales bacterium]
MADQLTILKPDDWHLHFRDGVLLSDTVNATARCFQRAIAMPNLVPPITNVKMALDYRDRILDSCEFNGFEPLMVIYLTDKTSAEDLKNAKGSGVVAGKLYPAGATTNSSSGVTDIENLYPVFEELEKNDLLLLVHGEVTDSEVDVFDREKVFIDQYLSKITKNFPSLRVVFEHITTKDSVEFVESGNENIAATITPQHLLFNRNDLFVGGIRPHNYCLPVLKRNVHQKALQRSVKLGNKKFFLGTDSAPHEKSKKESHCGCAGCYSAPIAIELYAHIFDQLDALDKLEGFASQFGPDFYRLPRNQKTITLVKETWTVPNHFKFGPDHKVVPLMAGQELNWKLI